MADLENRFAEFVGTHHAVAVSNGTAALHLALLAVGAGPGDDVVTPSLTFVAAANMIRHAGATPVFCDVVGSRDLNLDLNDLEAALTPRTKAIVALHYGGFACDIEAVTALAAERGLAVIEDAAHAIGANAAGRACGTFGSFGCFSFFSNKNLPIGEGGMLVTNDSELDARARLLRSHGMTTMTWDRQQGHASTYDVLVPGFNYRLDDIRAAMALVQLDRVPAATVERSRLARRYVERLNGKAGLRVAFAERDDYDTAAHHLAVVVLPDGLDRDELRAKLTAEGVQTSVHYPPIHHFAAYAGICRRSLPRTDSLAVRILTLPLYPGLSDELHELVCDRLVTAVVSR